VATSAERVAVHPASQSCPSESKELGESNGRTWAAKEVGGRACGSGNWALWLDWIVVPSGRDTVTGQELGCLWKQGA
jgi:hypothetical protein